MLLTDRDILEGLEKIPTPNYPGILIVTGKAQSVFTGSNAGETFLASCKYGKGKIFVSSHECYLNWLHEKDDGLKRKFMDNVKLWLTGEKVSDSKMIDYGELIRKKYSLSNYKLIKWHQDFDPTDLELKNLLSYIKNGGSLFCATTPWGYLEIYPDKKLTDMKMYHFLKDNIGILLTSYSLELQDEMCVTENKSQYSQFDIAIQKVTSSPENIENYFNTIHNGIDILREENFIDNKKIIDLKNLVLKNCVNSCWNVIPSEENPIEKFDRKNAVRLIGKCMVYADGEKAPGIEEFPGDFSKQPTLLENIELVLEAKFQDRLSTGYYLPAGSNLLVKVISGEIDGWSIRIGAHCDDLSDCESYKRWPCVSLVKKLTADMSICSPFGGLIYLESPGSGIVIINVSNVVESPFYDLKKPETVVNWIKRKNAPGLWTELAGENVIFTTPSLSIRHLENPKEVLQFWDSVIRTHHECRGTSVNDYRRERIVNDIQPYVGYMHSGYPIVTHLDCCQPDSEDYIFNLEKLKSNGNWNLFHEIGHNLQRDEWTFEGAEEVTVNIFSMHAFQFILGQDILKQIWLNTHKKNLKNFFSKKPTYKDWQNDCGIALITFAQLIKHFGWSSMHKFMKDYEEDIKNHQEKLPNTNQEKIDQWVIRYSKIVSKNIAPQFKMFGLPVSDHVIKELFDLEEWFSVQEL